MPSIPREDHMLRPRGQGCGDSTDTETLPGPAADEPVAEPVADRNASPGSSRNRHGATPQGSSSHETPEPTQQKRIRLEDGTHDIYLQVEAFGSGVVLHNGLRVSLGATVAELRQLVLLNAALAPRTRSVRLFVGHGGTELDDDYAKLASIPAVSAAELTEKPLVAFPTLCTSRATRKPCQGQRADPAEASATLTSSCFCTLLSCKGVIKTCWLQTCGIRTRKQCASTPTAAFEV